MAQRITVKCKYCGELFDRANTPCYKISTRYAHKDCFERIEENKRPKDAVFVEPKEEEKIERMPPEERKKIYDYIQTILGDNAKWQVIGKQITKFLNMGFTPKGIYQALYYWYNIQHHSIEKANGMIGIVEYIYDDAMEYYKRTEKINLVNEEKLEKKEIKISAQEQEIVKVKYQTPKNKIRSCYIGKEEEEN